jgi:hypothetical protein
MRRGRYPMDDPKWMLIGSASKLGPQRRETSHLHLD